MTWSANCTACRDDRSAAVARSDPFCLPQHIEAYSAEVFGHLAKERYLRGLDRDCYLDRLTHYLAEVNAIHPFREGNGRSQRAFFPPAQPGGRLASRLVKS